MFLILIYMQIPGCFHFMFTLQISQALACDRVSYGTRDINMKQDTNKCNILFRTQYLEKTWSTCVHSVMSKWSFVTYIVNRKEGNVLFMVIWRQTYG